MIIDTKKQQISRRPSGVKTDRAVKLGSGEGGGLKSANGRQHKASGKRIKEKEAQERAVSCHPEGLNLVLFHHLGGRYLRPNEVECRTH